MESWYVEQPQPTLNSGFETDEWNDYVLDSFDEALTETPLGTDVYLCSGLYDSETEAFETEYETKAVIQNRTPDAYTQGFKRQVLARISDNLAEYKYIKAKDTLGTWQIYLIVTMPETNGIYTKAVIHECNYVLRWQDKKTKDIYNYPCLIENASQYNIGENSVNSVIRYGFGQVMCWMPLDDITLRVKRDYRFFIDYNKEEPLVYRATSMDRVTYSYRENRIIRFVLTEDLYNPDVDNIDLWICDYNSDTVPQPPSPIVISYVGEPEIRIGGRKTLRVQSDSTVTFSLLADSSLDNKVTIEQSDNQCVVRCVNDTNIIGSHFKVIATCNGEHSELLMTIKGVM